MALAQLKTSTKPTLDVPVTLWKSTEEPSVGDVRLQSLGQQHWSVRVKQKREWVWGTITTVLQVEHITNFLPVLPTVALHVWVPSPKIGTIVVDSTSKRREILATWHAFPTLQHAALHQVCHEASNRVIAVHGANDLLGAFTRSSRTTSFKDPAVWLSSTPYLLAKASLNLALARSVPLGAACEALKHAGFETLPEDAAEIAVGLVSDWSKDLPELISAVKLITS